MTDNRVTFEGNRVFLDGAPIALACNVDAAFIIAWCLNHARRPDVMNSYPYADEDERRVQEFFA